MCTSIVVNKKKTIVGWNLDIMVFDVTDKAVYWCHNRDYGQIETKRF